MSREWDTYNLTCNQCGTTGTIRTWSDDWNRWGAEWESFKGKVYVTGPKAEFIECEKCGTSGPTIERLQ